jgi:hypothetical protein
MKTQPVRSLCASPIAERQANLPDFIALQEPYIRSARGYGDNAASRRRAQRPTANFRSANCGLKSLASQQRLKVVEWPVVALASVPASDGYWSAQVRQESGSPKPQLNATLRNNTTQRQQRRRLQAKRYASLGHTSVRWLTYSGAAIIAVCRGGDFHHHGQLKITTVALS